MCAGAEKAAGRGGEDSNGGATAEATGKIRFNVLPRKEWNMQGNFAQSEFSTHFKPYSHDLNF